MKNEELRELLATKVMGWSLQNFNEYDYWVEPETGNRILAKFWMPDLDFNDTDKIIEVFAKEPFAWNIESINIKNEKTKWWACLWGDNFSDEITVYEATEDTKQMAICKVVLKKIQAEEKKD